MDNLKIISDFKQGVVSDKVTKETQDCLNDKVVGNCVTIALIKAALVSFESIDRVFENYEENENGVDCVMFNEERVSITNDEVAKVKELSGIIANANSEYYNDAIKLYTIICKRIYNLKSRYSEKCIHNFINAIEYINCGFPTRKANELLGLKQVKIKVKHLKRHKSVIINTGAHASYSSYGNQDIMGALFVVKTIPFVRFMKNPKGPPMPVTGAHILIQK